MSEGAGEHYKGYYIRTVARAVNHPRNGMTVLFEGTATVSLDPGAQYQPIPPDSHLGEDQVFGTEEGTTDLAQLLNAQSEDHAEHQHRIDQFTPKSPALGVRTAQVASLEGQGGSREHDVVRLSDRPFPGVVDRLADDLFLERTSSFHHRSGKVVGRLVIEL